METMDQRESLYEAQARATGNINQIAQQASQIIRRDLSLSPEEFELVMQHRQMKEKEIHRKRIIACIDAAVTRCTNGCSINWNGWPGTTAITRAVFEGLVSKGYINDAN